MKSMDQKLAATVRSLSRDPVYTEFIEWLRESLEATREQNDFLEGIELTRSQGKAQTLDMILRSIENSDEACERFAMNQRLREQDNLDDSTVE